MLLEISRRALVGFSIAILGGAIAGCGAIYTPQEFEKSAFSYGYKGDFDVAIEVVTMTFTSARAANSDGYTPRALPGAYENPAPITSFQPQERLNEMGLNEITPPLLFDPPFAPVPYDSDREVLPPPLRNETLQPIPVPDPLYLPLPPGSQPQTSELLKSVAPRIPSPVSGNAAKPYTIDAETGTALLSVQGATSASEPAGSSRAGLLGRQAQPFQSDVDLDLRLERPELRRSLPFRPLPFISPPPYRVGPGDVISIQTQEGAVGAVNITSQNLTVQYNGEIFVPKVGAISVGGLTLPEARRIINDGLVSSGLGFDPTVQIVTYGSKNVSISGLKNSQVLPISVRPVTLGEAVVSVGGLGPKPENTIVQILRDGETYSMSGDRIIASGELADRVLLDGDLVSITSSYDPTAAVTYFNQQLQLREIARNDFVDNLALTQAQRSEKQFELDQQRFQTQEQRAQTQMALERRRERLSVDRLRREVETSRLKARRETNQVNENARIANVETRQAYLDQLRTLEELNRQAMRATRQETRAILTANQAELLRIRAERLALLELEFSHERTRLDLLSSQRQEERSLFSEQMQLGAVERDYITIAGETRTQLTMPLPFDGRLTLNRVLYEETNGIDPVSGDASEIYVFRTPPQDRIQDRVLAFHLNASNPAALAVASIFEMRPNDVVYVNPQPITKWNRVLTQILPSTGLLQSGISTTSALGN